MSTTLYMVTCRIPAPCTDGRSTEAFWGHENQFHSSREDAEAACERLSERGRGPCRPDYDVEEVRREDFPEDSLGESEWRTACRQAGLDDLAGRHPVLSWLASLGLDIGG